MSKSFRKRIDRGKQVVVPAARLDGNNKWGLWVSPHLWLSSESVKAPPARWFQFWQRVLLGWRWERR